MHLTVRARLQAPGQLPIPSGPRGCYSSRSPFPVDHRQPPHHRTGADTPRSRADTRSPELLHPDDGILDRNSDVDDECEDPDPASSTVDALACSGGVPVADAVTDAAALACPAVGSSPENVAGNGAENGNKHKRSGELDEGQHKAAKISDGISGVDDDREDPDLVRGARSGSSRLERSGCGAQGQGPRDLSDGMEDDLCDLLEPVDDDADLASSLLFPAGSTFALPRPAPWRLRERAS